MINNLENLIENIKSFFPAIVMVVGILWFLGGQLTFAWLISKDAQTHHSYFDWIYLIFSDVLITLFWPLFWVIEIIRDRF